MLLSLLPLNLGFIYTTGEYFSSSSSFGEKYDEYTDEWLPIKNMKHVRRDHALVSLGGSLYVIVLLPGIFPELS